MNWEIITFLGYFVILLGVALIFYFNGSNKIPRTSSWVAAPWARGSRRCPHRPLICQRGC